MAQRMTRKQLLKQDDLTEVAFDFGHWLEQHWMKVLKWAGGVALVGLAVLAGVLLVNSRKTARETLLASAQRQFQDAQAADFANSEDLSGALSGFEQVIAKAGNSEAGQVAQYFKVASLRKLGRNDEAIAAAEELTGKTSLPATLQISSELLLVDLYIEAGRAQDAIARLSASLESTTPVVPTEQALVKIGRIHKEQGDLEAAHAAWKRVVDEFPGSRAATDARQLLGPDA
jgi:tetratricopeptide (TPR) repeat protein